MFYVLASQNKIHAKIQGMTIFFLCLTLLGAYLSAVPFWLNNLAIVGVLGLLFSYARERSWRWITRLNGYELPFGLMIFAAWWSAGDAYLPAQAIGDALSLTLLIGLFYFLAAAVQSKKDMDFLLKTVFAGYVLVLLCGIYQYAMVCWQFPALPGVSSLLEAKGLPRLSSVFIQRSGANVFTAFMSLAAPIYIGWFFQEIRIQKNYLKVLHALVLALTIFNVLFSFSRALLVTLVLVFVYVALTSRYWKQFLTLGAITLTIAVLTLPPLQRTTQTLFDREDISNVDHYMSIVISAEQILQHPLNGWGGGHINTRLKYEDGSWIDLRGKYRTQEEIYQSGWEKNIHIIRSESLADGVIYVFSPHNMYLGYFLEYGFLSFLGVILLTFFTYRRLSRLPGALARSLLLGIIGFAIYGVFHDSIRAPIMAYLFWFYLILVVKLEESLRGFNVLQYRRVLVLAYHRVLPVAGNTLAVSIEQFTRQINYLRRKKYLFLNAEEFCRRFVAGTEPLNHKICLITFDDGYRDNLQYAFPFLQKYKIPATIFATVNKIGDKEPYYWDLKNMLEFSADDLPLNWPELKKLQKAGWAIGSHTLNHYELKQLADKEVQTELTQSKKILEKNLEKKIDAVCYPRGSVDERVLKLARAAGYKLGFMTNSRMSSILAFPRVGIYSHDNFLRFWLKLFCRRFR